MSAPVSPWSAPLPSPEPVPSPVAGPDHQWPCGCTTVWVSVRHRFDGAAFFRRACGSHRGYARFWDLLIPAGETDELARSPR